LGLLWVHIEEVFGNCWNKQIVLTVLQLSEIVISDKEKWGKEYPFAIRSWEKNWNVLSSFYTFSDNVCKITFVDLMNNMHEDDG
jgi:hypothetical protein